MKPLTDNMKQTLAVLAEWGNAAHHHLSTLNALQSRGLCKVTEHWDRNSLNHLRCTAKLTDAGRKLAAELAAAAEAGEKGGAV